MLDALSQWTFASFCARTLPRSDWTHEAHLRVCWAALSERTPTETVAFLRSAIRAYNQATGVDNTPTNGYHETLTRYFVDAVASLGAASVDDVIGAPRCRVDAPLRHWSRVVLFSRLARAHWVEPDLAELPWSSSRLSDGVDRLELRLG